MPLIIDSREIINVRKYGNVSQTFEQTTREKLRSVHTTYTSEIFKKKSNKKKTRTKTKMMKNLQ